MITEIISADEIQRALDVLGRGGLVAFPTDTVYGLGALAFDANAIAAIYEAKQRPAEKAIPILIASVDDLPRIVQNIPGMARRLAARFWPGPLTLLVPKLQTLPASVSATDTVGVRVPDHAVALALLRAAGPMAVTSANISGRESPVSAQGVLDQLSSRIPLVIDGGTAPGGSASTVVDCSGAEPLIVRAGPISLAALNGALR